MLADRQQPSLQNYAKDEEGNTVIPPSRRPDGSWRKEIKIREGFVPQDEIPAYQSRGQPTMQQNQKPKAAKPVGMTASQKQPSQLSPATTAIGGSATGLPNANKQKKAQNPSGTGQQKKSQHIDEASRATAQLSTTKTAVDNDNSGAGGSRVASTRQAGGGADINPSSGGAGDDGEWQVVKPKKSTPGRVSATSNGKVDGGSKIKASTDQVPQKVSKESKKAGGGEAGLQSTALKQQTSKSGSRTAKGATSQQGAAGSSDVGGGGNEQQASKPKQASAAGKVEKTKAAAVGAGQTASNATPSGVVLKQNAPATTRSVNKTAGESVGLAAANGAGITTVASKLRGLKKKLRDIKELEDQIKAKGVKPNPDQEEKLKKKKQLQSEIKQLEQQKAAA